MKLSRDDLSLLVDALEGTRHLDTTTKEEDHRDDLTRRLLEEFEHQTSINEIAELLFS